LIHILCSAVNLLNEEIELKGVLTLQSLKGMCIVDILDIVADTFVKVRKSVGEIPHARIP